MTTKTRTTTKARAPRSAKNTRLKKRMNAALTALTGSDLIKHTADAGPGAYSFKHALVQETAQANLLHGEHKRLHLLVAQAYEHVYAERGTDAFAAVLAQHYAAAGEDRKTIEYATRAGDLAQQVYANPEAIAHFTTALNAARALQDNAALKQLYLKRGRAYELMSQHGRALENYTEMEQVAQANGDRAMELAASMACTTIHSTPNAKFDKETAKERSRSSLVLARELEDRASEARILWNLMLLSHFESAHEEAIVYGEQAVALARELHLTEQLAYALNDISRPYMMTRRYTDGMAASYEAYELWQLLDNKPMLTDNLNTRATTLFNLGDYERAIAFSQEAYDIGEAIHNPWTQAHSLMTQSFVYADQGEVARAIETMNECLDKARRVGFLIAIASVQAALANTYGLLGDVERGLELIRSPQLPASNLHRWEMAALAFEARLYLMAGDAARARSLIEASIAAGRAESLSPFQIGTTFLADAELGLAEGDYEHALNMSDKLLHETHSRGIRFYGQYGMYVKGQALVGLGRTEQAVEILQLARAEEERSGARRNLWRILALLGDIERLRDNEPAATELYARARAVLKFIIEHTPAEYQESFSQLPAVRQVME